MALKGNMREYGLYVNHLEALVSGFEKFALPEREQKCHLALNGGPTEALKKVVDTKERRDLGIFFTGDSPAYEVFKEKLQGSTEDIYFDPACGSGDLLLAAANNLSLGENLEETLKKWGQQLMGVDIHEPFAQATRARLAILALSRGASPVELNPTDLRRCMPHIRKGDCLTELVEYYLADWILLNPPFSKMQIPKNCVWGRGSGTAAAVFLEQIVSRLNKGTKVIAVLPDVLRSGSRYNKWRGVISSRANIRSIDLSGRFSKDTDVDVFILTAHALETEASDGRWASLVPIARNLSSSTISDFFDVHVGSVVPHRDPLCGPSYPFVNARTTRPWQVIKRISEKRKYSGSVFTPPFVIVNRTSGPRDKHRCVASIIEGQRSVAIENHLIVIQPKDKSLQSCIGLSKVLRSQFASDWFNERIRCRHLTVSAVRELPLIKCQDIN